MRSMIELGMIIADTLDRVQEVVKFEEPEEEGEKKDDSQIKQIYTDLKAVKDGTKFTKFATTFKLSSILASDDAIKIRDIARIQGTFNNRYVSKYCSTIEAKDHDIMVKVLDHTSKESMVVSLDDKVMATMKDNMKGNPAEFIIPKGQKAIM